MKKETQNFLMKKKHMTWSKTEKEKRILKRKLLNGTKETVKMKKQKTLASRMNARLYNIY